MIINCSSNLLEFENQLSERIFVNNSRNIRIRPSETTSIRISILVDDIETTNVGENFKAEVKLQLYQSWEDHRLAYNISEQPDYQYLPLNALAIKRIWSTDLVFSTALKADFHFVMVPHGFVWIYPDGTVLYKLQVSVTIRCRHDLNESKLHCPLKIQSFGSTSDQIKLEWNGEDPVTYEKSVYLPEYEVGNVLTESIEVVTKIGNFSTLLADLILKSNF
ncbi:unnamed protein product [Orchesella dallaii]|uniref:Neurotransmitter-gated ion-channel ligand-binding domain-containing protein n=1 Tax=Orchesella dallaii TaxID=48710 RepID=A0ABP1RFP4_9HEXA